MAARFSVWVMVGATLLSGCACDIAAQRVQNELPVVDGYVRLIEAGASREDLVQMVYKSRQTFYVLDHVLNDGPNPIDLDLSPPGGWAVAPITSR